MREFLTLMMLSFFLCFFTKSQAQNIRFSYETTIVSPTVTDVKIYTQTTSGTENLTGYTTYFYYDNTETTLTGYDSAPTTTTLGWGAANQTATLFTAENNANVGSTHTGYFFYQNFDNAFTGDDCTTTPTHLLTLTFDHTVGTSASGSGWLAETDEVPPMNYVDNLFTGYNVIATGTQSQDLKSSPLPVELMFFTAKAEDKQTRLEWSTANELNNKGFEIEKLNANERWEKIGYVEGNGNSNNVHTYFYFDEKPSSGINYYRLKQIDYDGKFEYSEVESVTFEGGNPIYSIYPNPTITNKVNVEIPNDETEVSIFDGKGRLMYFSKMEKGTGEVSLAQFSSGMYFVKFVNGKDVQIKRLVIQE